MNEMNDYEYRLGSAGKIPGGTGIRAGLGRTSRVWISSSFQSRYSGSSDSRNNELKFTEYLLRVRHYWGPFITMLYIPENIFGLVCKSI